MPRTQRPHILVLASVLLAAFVVGGLPAGNVDAYTTVYYNGAGSAPRISIIGDSTIAALRWTNTFEPLKRFNFVYDAESCRRTATASCRGREGYQPDNVIAAMRRLSGQLGSALVLMGGYDDPGSGFATAVDAVMAEAVRQGIPHVVWLTLRTADVTYVGPTFSSNTFTFRDNNRILLQKSQQYGGRLQIADWATYSASRTDWFYADGIHMRPSGAAGAASYIASSAGRVLAGETITPPPGTIVPSPWRTVRRGDRGSAVVTVQQALINAGYGLFGGADGVFESATQDAVRRFQRANHLIVNGLVDTATARRLGLANLGGAVTLPSWRELRIWSSGLAVSAAQQALIDRGVYVRNGANGIFDLYTAYAVSSFQRRNSLPVTGVIDAATATKLGLFTGSTWFDLRLNASGPAVRSAQRALLVAGVRLRGGATGTFDINTYYAVRSYQRWRGLPVTGILDAATARELGLVVAPGSTAVWTNLGMLATGSRVASVQRALIDHGVVMRGGVTGRFDLYTFYAVQTFQRSRRMPVTGIVDGSTARALGLFDLDDPEATWRPLRMYSNGALVLRAEQALAAAGVPVRGSGVDGTFDLYTYYAVSTYQRYHALSVTGIIDAATARSLGLFENASAATVMLATAPPLPASTTPTTTPTTTAPTPLTASAPAAAPALVTDRATVGGLVWSDLDGDGVQDHDEPGIVGVAVVLVDSTGAETQRVVTDAEGRFELAAAAAVGYTIHVELPDGYVPAPVDQGGDDADDSDLLEPVEVFARLRIARTEPFTVAAGVDDLDLDAGLVVAPDTDPSAPSGSTPATSSSSPAQAPATTTATTTATTVPTSTIAVTTIAVTTIVVNTSTALAATSTTTTTTTPTTPAASTTMAPATAAATSTG